MRSESSHAAPGAARDSAISESLATGERLMVRLCRRFPYLSLDTLHDAVTDAVIEWHLVGEHSDAIDPGRLYLAASRNAVNSIRSDAARKRRETAWQRTQLRQLEPPGPPGVSFPESRSPDSPASPSLVDRPLAAVIASIDSQLLDERMRTVFRLCTHGSRDTRIFAAALNISQLPPEEQRRIVKREKDRLKKYLQRTHATRELVAAAASDMIC